jgi:hypothetical protein
MVIREINDKKQWNSFFERCHEKTFCQSWNWGEFNKKWEILFGGLEYLKMMN